MEVQTIVEARLCQVDEVRRSDWHPVQRLPEVKAMGSFVGPSFSKGNSEKGKAENACLVFLQFHGNPGLGPKKNTQKNTAETKKNCQSKQLLEKDLALDLTFNIEENTKRSIFIGKMVVPL